MAKSPALTLRRVFTPAALTLLMLSGLFVGVLAGPAVPAAEARTCTTTYHGRLGFEPRGDWTAYVAFVAWAATGFSPWRFPTSLPGHAYVEFPVSYNPSTDRLSGVRPGDFWGGGRFGIGFGNLTWPWNYTLTRTTRC